MKQIIFASLILMVIACALGRCDGVPAASSGHKMRIVLVGDSTVADRSGWGLGFLSFLDTNSAECINVAVGGRSSLSFMREGRWTNALALKGDYYLIQFGHNNQPGKPGRSTDMPTFVANMKQYVDDARAIGAKPVLVTPLTRRQFDKNDPHKINSTLEPYAVEVRKLAAEENVPLVDLHARSVELCEQLGREKCYEFSPTKLEGGTNGYDGTHLNEKGRVLFGRLVVEELRKAVPELSSVLLAQPREENPAIASDKYDAIFSSDFSADYKSLQTAIDAAPDNGSRPFRILVKPGIYEGQFIEPKEKRRIELFGEDAKSTILTFNFNVQVTNGTVNPRFKGTGFVVLGDDFSAENITFQNTSGDHGQALALRVDGDRATFKNCRLLGWQDTLMVNNGRDYFEDCYVEGRVDFIYGSAAAVFDRCEIHSKNGGHVTAANTPREKPFGLVFMNCRLTGDTNPWVSPEGIPANTNSAPLADLGRPWRPYASVTYLNCEMGAHIRAAGWNNWRNPTNELTARFAEYNSTGPGANPDGRVKWARQLTKEEADKISIKSVLAGDDAWNPNSEH